MEYASPAPAGALCATHAERAASHVCARCGSFMCEECSLGGSNARCPACLQLNGGTLPFNRDDYDFSRVWDFVFELWKQHWVMLSVAVLIFFGIAMVGGVVGSVMQQVGLLVAGKNAKAMMIAGAVGVLLSQGVSAVTQGVAQLGLNRVLLDVLRGRAPDMSRMFTQVSKLPAYLAQYLAMGVVVLLPIAAVMAVVFGVLLTSTGESMSSLGEHPERWFTSPAILGSVAAGTLVSLPLLFILSPIFLVPLELVYAGGGAIDAIRRAFIIGSGHRLSLFGYSFVGGLVAMLGMLACCVGIFPAMALQQSLMATLYLTLREGSGLPTPSDT